jgi:UDP-N-acetylmuramoyl-L-alanyl-D-glutamate--2,6-diaminopimelate ligase
MRLSELAAGFPITPATADPDITGITEDSRRVRNGMLFVAVAGTALDGHAYIAEAVSRGAAAVVAERTGAIPPGVPIVRVPSSRAALAVLAARFAGTRPGKPAIIGFTGTFGKTSTSEILRALLEAGGIRVGIIGSLGARYSSFSQESHGLTTPAPVELHRMLRDLEGAGADTIIMEVTSHALRLCRVDGLRFAGGLLAAIMPGEHTDFHRSYENYVEAKRLFLAHLDAGVVLAYDADNLAARRVAAEAYGKETIGFSLDGRDADLMFDNVLLDVNGATFALGGRLAGGGSGVRLQSALLGRGHLRNVALALTYALGTGIPLATARGVLPRLTPLRRRMERYEVAGRIVLDDTAAHPDSFRATFEVASLLPHKAMVVVYAVRGRRGVDINRRNALALADLSSMYGVEPLIVTASADVVGSSDSASAAEIDAARQALVGRGRRFVWQDPLEAALCDALDRTLAGDLILLVGAQGMDRGQEILFGSHGHQPPVAAARPPVS